MKQLFMLSYLTFGACFATEAFERKPDIKPQPHAVVYGWDTCQTLLSKNPNTEDIRRCWQICLAGKAEGINPNPSYDNEFLAFTGCTGLESHLQFKDSKGNTPLHYAVEYDKIHFALLLLELGVKPQKNDNNLDPFQLALNLKNQDMIKTMIEVLESKHSYSMSFGTHLKYIQTMMPQLYKMGTVWLGWIVGFLLLLVAFLLIRKKSKTALNN